MVKQKVIAETGAGQHGLQLQQLLHLWDLNVQFLWCKKMLKDKS